MGTQLVNPDISIIQQVLNWDIQIPDAVWDFLYSASAWLNVIFGSGVFATFAVSVFTLWLSVVAFRVLVFVWKLLPLT